MSTPTDIRKREDSRQEIRFGIPLGLYPADSEYPMDIRMAPDSGGSPDVGSAEMIAYRIPGDTEVYIHELPNDGLVRWFSIRHSPVGIDPSDWTDWVDGIPALIPKNLERSTGKMRVRVGSTEYESDALVITTVASDVAVTLDADGRPTLSVPHVSRTDNPHSVTAAQVGARAAADPIPYTDLEGIAPGRVLVSAGVGFAWDAIDPSGALVGDVLTLTGSNTVAWATPSSVAISGGDGIEVTGPSTNRSVAVDLRSGLGDEPGLVFDSGKLAVAFEDENPGAPDAIYRASAVDTALAGKADTSHVHAAGDVTSGVFNPVRGGTGLAILTTGNLFVGQGLSPMTALAPGADGGFVRSNGSAWVRSTIGTGDLPATVAYTNVANVFTVRQDVNSSFRVRGLGTSWTTGSGVEIYYNAGQGEVFAYNRDTAAFLPLRLRGGTGTILLDANAINLTGDDVVLDAGAKLRADGASAGDTYLVGESGGADRIDLVAGGDILRWNGALNALYTGGVTGTHTLGLPGNRFSTIYGAWLDLAQGGTTVLTAMNTLLAVDARRWDVTIEAGNLLFRARTDAGITQAAPLQLNRTGEVAVTDDITVGGDAILASGSKLRLDGSAGGDDYLTSNGAGQIDLYASGNLFRFTSTDFRGAASQTLGTASVRWSTIYGTTLNLSSTATADQYIVGATERGRLTYDGGTSRFRVKAASGYALALSGNGANDEVLITGGNLNIVSGALQMGGSQVISSTRAWTGLPMDPDMGGTGVTDWTGGIGKIVLAHGTAFTYIETSLASVGDVLKIATNGAIPTYEWAPASTAYTGGDGINVSGTVISIDPYTGLDTDKAPIQFSAGKAYVEIGTVAQTAASGLALANHEAASNPHGITKTTVGLSAVENTALSTWAGSSNLTTLASNAVSNAELRDSAALSVIGRSANSTGDPADIAAGTDGHVLRRSGTTLGFGTISNSSLASGAYSNITGLGTITSGVWQGTPVTVSNGGTGQTSFATGNLLLGNAGSSLSVLAPGAAGGFVRSNGTAWVRSTIQSSDLSGLSIGASQVTAGTFGSGNFRFQGQLVVGPYSPASPGTGRVAVTGTGAEISIGDRSQASADTNRWVIYNDNAILRFYHGSDLITVDSGGTITTAANVRVGTTRNSPSSGNGLEMFWYSAGSAWYIEAYDYSAPAYKELRFRGSAFDFNATLTSSGGFVDTSRRDWKDNIEDWGINKGAVMAFRLRTWLWNENAGEAMAGIRGFGGVSDEVHPMFATADGKGIVYNRLLAQTVGVVQEHETEIEKLRRENVDLRRRVEMLEAA